MPISGALDLLDAVESLGILSGPQASGLRSEWEGDCAVSAEEAGSRLVQRRMLTAFQVQRLLEGDGESLVVGGRYQVRELLGAGGMGQVFLAHDVQLGRSVALKVLPPALVRDEGAVARFKREAKAMARLAHPNIVQAYDAGSDGEQHFLVMEHVDGASLAHMLKQGRALESAVAADYAYQAALGLDHAHQKGIVHRDFKPGNVLITRHQQVKILDLGLARFVQDQIEDETLTQDGTALGTPDYMAPEQFGGAKHADARSDVYALGCTLYHMLIGRVPFPGSSLSEKRQAHLKAEPEPVEAHAPNVPTGLSQAVSKMMAKRPNDRFQTAAQCAEALLPYVAASSSSLPNLRTTASWVGGQLSLMTAPQRRRRNLKWGSIGAAILLIGSAGGFGLSKWLGRGRSDLSTTSTKPAPGGDSKKTDVPAASIEADPWVLTVSQDPKGGGQYRSINEALKDVKPGMTVRLIDSETYNERLVLTDPKRLTGLTLEAVANAKILNEGSSVATIQISGIPYVTIRGLRLHATGMHGAHFLIRGDCRGAALEDLVVTSEHGNRWNGIEFVEANAESSEMEAVVVQRCQFKDLQSVATLMSSKRVVFRNNLISDVEWAACQLVGSMRHVLIVGNRFERCSRTAIHLVHLADEAELLILNNTFIQDARALRIEGKRVPHCSIRIVNNLSLASADSDFVFFMSEDPNVPGHIPGDVDALKQEWVFAHNWRETKSLVMDKSWIPPAESDVTKDTIVSIDRDPNSPNYLRPAADSPLATQGAGNTEPSLPRYVGALPPKGVDAWDWDRTWVAPPGTSELLTVSKEPDKGGKYRSITDALKDAKPWTTIRVLDDDVYPESIRLDDAERQEGIALEAPNGATIERLAIFDVPSVVLRGFRLRPRRDAFGAVLDLTGKLDGCVLERLEISEMPVRMQGIVVRDVSVPRDQSPLVIRKVRIAGKQRGGRGIQITSSLTAKVPTRGVCLRDNYLANLGEGIQIDGFVEDIHVVGTVIHDCANGALNPENLAQGSSGILFANNMAFDSNIDFQFDDNEPFEEIRPGQCEVTGNVFFNAMAADVARTRVSADGAYNSFGAKELIDTWRFRRNWRDGSGAEAAVFGAPLVEGKLELIRDLRFVSKARDNPNFMRPEKDSPLATGGAGGDLPTYAGAIPPEGVEPWDWDITWRSRARRALSKAQTGGD